MAARGARSRKVVEKQINKEAQKNGSDRFASIASPTPGSTSTSSGSKTPTSPISGWGRKGSSVVSSAASTVSRDSASSRLSNAGGKLGSKLSGINKGERFVDKGKSTSAPRGRRGGVPVKASEVKNIRDSYRSVKGRRSVISPPGFRPNTSTAAYADMSHTAVRTWDKTKIWNGGGAAPKPYLGFENDDDMWMSDGNCLIFFSEETTEEDPKPMLRVHTQTLEQARSTFMINLLRYGEIVAEDDESTPPSSRSGPSSPGSFNSWPLTESSLGNLDELLNHPSFNPPRTPDLPSRRSTGSHTWSTSGQTYIPDREGGPPVLNRNQGSLRIPGISEHDGSETSAQERPDSPTSGMDPSASVEITHEIWFRAPSHIKRPDIQRRHHMATRNYLALLYGLPLIGNDLCEMLSDLHNVMDTYYELNETSERWNSAQVIVQYLVQRKLDDVRGNLPAALGLMAWAEQSNVGWDAGYLEGFVHSVGMMTPQTVQMQEFKHLSQVSRHKMQNAYNALQLRLIEAEERLGRFEFPELWYAEGTTNSHPAQRAYEEFRVFLANFYHNEYGRWPPREHDHQGHWISKSVVNRMQADLGALYDYLVDRDVSWDVSEERHTRKWEMVCTASHRSASFMPDSPGLPLTNMLVGFDSSMRYEHIPHPFPLLPYSNAKVKEKIVKKGFFSKFQKSAKEQSTVPGPKEQYQMALAFNAATNVDRLGNNLKDNKLLDAFQAHEKSYSPSTLGPADARLGRWILLYAVLQVLSTLSVDVIGLKFSEKIRYFASPSLDGCPPWRSAAANGAEIAPINPASGSGGAGIMREASQNASYCWLAPERWRDAERGGATPTPANPGAYQSLNQRAAIVSTRPPALRSNVGGGSQASLDRLSELDGRAIVRSRSNKSPAIMTAAGTANSSPSSTPRLNPGLSPMMSPRMMSPPGLAQPGLVESKPEVPGRNPSRERWPSNEGGSEAHEASSGMRGMMGNYL